MDELQKRWDTARGLIQHEDGLTNQRLTWLLTLQGFLFAALTLGAGTLANGMNTRYHGPVVFFLLFVVLSGILSPLLQIRPLRAAKRQIHAVRYWWEKFGRLQNSEWAALPVENRYPPIIGDGNQENAYGEFGIPTEIVDRRIPWSSYWHLPEFLVGIWALVLCVWCWLLILFLSAPSEPASKVTISQDRSIDKVNVDFKP